MLHTVRTGLYAAYSTDRTVCCIQYGQVCMLHTVRTGLYAAYSTDRSVCCIQYGQVCMLHTVRTGLYAAYSTDRSVCCIQYGQVCMLHTVRTGLYTELVCCLLSDSPTATPCPHPSPTISTERSPLRCCCLLPSSRFPTNLPSGTALTHWQWLLRKYFRVLHKWYGLLRTCASTST